MAGKDERRRLWSEIREWFRRASWALGGGWALEAGFHGVPFGLAGGSVGSKGQKIVPTVQPEDVRDLTPTTFHPGRSRGEVRTVVIGRSGVGKSQQIVHEHEALLQLRARHLRRRRNIRRVGVVVGSLAVLALMLRR